MKVCPKCEKRYELSYAGNTCTKCLVSLQNLEVMHKKPMSMEPKTFEEMEIKLILENKKLKKAKEAEIAEKLKINLKTLKLERMELKGAEDGDEEEEDSEEKDEDNFAGDEF